MLYVRETPNGKKDYIDVTGFRLVTDEEKEQLRIEKEKKLAKKKKQEQINAIMSEIAMYKRKFEDGKYLQEKYVDGALTEEEYAPIREERESWRVEIRRLEEELKELQEA